MKGNSKSPKWTAGGKPSARRIAGRIASCGPARQRYFAIQVNRNANSSSSYISLITYSRGEAPANECHIDATSPPYVVHATTSNVCMDVSPTSGNQPGLQLPHRGRQQNTYTHRHEEIATLCRQLPFCGVSSNVSSATPSSARRCASTRQG